MKKCDEYIDSLERELKELKKRVAFYEEALYSLPNPVFIKDDELKFCFFNKSYMEFFHLKEGEYLGLRVEDLPYLSEEDRKRYRDEDNDAVTNSSIVHYETSYPDKDKPRESFYWSKGFVTKEGQRGLIGEIVDISNEKRLERELMAYAHEMELHGIRAEEDSMKDQLTGLYNRRVFDKIIPSLVYNSNQKQKEIYAFIIDLDFFKTVNDTYGHAEGDRVLCDFSEMIRNNLRASDYAIRYGGDEFVLVIPGISEQAALKKGEHLCRAAEESIRLPDGSAVTCSIGISGHNKENSLKYCMQRADSALYEAKESGRNTARMYKNS